MPITKMNGYAASNHPTSLEIPGGASDQDRQSSGHSAASGNNDIDSIFCGFPPSATLLKKIPRKASSLWNRLLGRSSKKSNSGVDSQNAESILNNKLLSRHQLKTTIPEPLIKTDEDASSPITREGFVDRSNMKAKNSDVQSNEIRPSVMEFFNSLKEDSDYEEVYQYKFPKPNTKELNKLVETADGHWPNKRKFILDQTITSGYALDRLLEEASDDERVRIFSHDTFHNLDEGYLYDMIKNTSLTENQRLAILNHKNVDDDVFYEFLRNNLPHNIKKKERLAIAGSPRASMHNLKKLYETLPENAEDALEESLAILMNPKVEGGAVVESILERLPRRERMRIIPKASSMIITFLVQRLTLSKTKMQDFNAAEYQEELNAIIENENTCDDDLWNLIPDVGSDKRTRKIIINHRNAGELSLPLLVEKASPDECEEIWNRTLDIGVKRRSNPESNLPSNCWSTWKALQNNKNCPPLVRDEINLKFAREEGPLPLHERVLRWQSESAS